MHVIVCASVCEFRGQNSFKGEECKTRKNIIFLKKGKTVICRYSKVGNLEIF